MKKFLVLAICAAMLFVLAVPVAAATNMTAPKAEIVLDGERDDAYGEGYDIKSMQDGTPGATGKVWTAWDDNYLYYYFEVSDTTPNHENENDYGRDCVEMFIDWYNKKDADTSDSANPYWQYRTASAPNADGQQFSNGINQAAGEDGTGWSIEEHVNSQTANNVVKLTANGYTVETRLEYKKFGINIAEGSVVGVDFMIGDNQEDAGRTSCAWLDPEFMSNNQWQYPSEVGGLLTLGAPVAVAEPEPEPVVEEAAPAPAAEEAAPAPVVAATPAPVAAPSTGSTSLFIFAIALIGAFAVSKKIIRSRV